MNILAIVGGIGVIALLFAVYASGKINAFKVENARVNELSGIIQGGAMAFLYREYKALVPFVIIVAALLAWKINVPSAVCFVAGAACSALTGYVGMKVATKSNGKTAFAAMHGMNDALTVAFMPITLPPMKARFFISVREPSFLSAISDFSTGSLSPVSAA